MFERVSVPVLGIVGKCRCIFVVKAVITKRFLAQAVAEKMAEKYNVKVLAQLPLHIRIREDLDAGNPTVVRSA